MPDAARPAPLVGTVVRTEQVSPHLVRVVLGGLDGFRDPVHADSYVNAQFLPPGAGPDQRAFPRRYTVRSWDPERRELAVDFVVHGDEGIAGPWAVRARPGDRLEVRGPAGAYDPDPAADAHLLVGDASALPAIAVALERVPAGVPVLAVVQVPAPEDEIALVSPGALELHWVHGDGGQTSLLAERLAGLVRPAGRVHAFVHGEAESIRAVRRLLLTDWGLARDDLSCSPYWRHGDTDETWRQVKGAWTRDMELDVPAA